ncbi:MAG: hypothetical protein MZV70_37740 [Desulfobacterales bacterium]|nr:hypothetical protein [Desulfobacterales bacterium]
MSRPVNTRLRHQYGQKVQRKAPRAAQKAASRAKSSRQGPRQDSQRASGHGRRRRKSRLKTKSDKKAIQELLAKGKKQGFLTYDEINEMLPEDMLSPDQIDETLMLFDDNGIEVVDEKQNKKVVKT